MERFVPVDPTVQEVVISAEVVEGRDARPLYIYSDRKKDEALTSA